MHTREHVLLKIRPADRNELARLEAMNYIIYLLKAFVTVLLMLF